MPINEIPLYQRLYFKQAKSMLLIAVALGIVFSIVQITFDYFDTCHAAGRTATEVLEISKTSALQAAYNFDTDLAREVVNGVSKYHMFHEVELSNELNVILAEQRQPAVATRWAWLADYWFQKHREYSIKLEKSGQIYGIIKVKVDIYQLAESFIKRTRLTLLTGLAQALLFAAGLFLLLRVLLTRPLEQLSDRLAHIDAHNPEKLRLDIPVGHENDELGRLAIVANQLLESIEEKVSLQHQLNEELEQRVAERTQELAFANHEISALNERLAAENSRMGAELEITRKLQQMVLPKEEELAAIQELDIACFMQPATEVGGDYYDVLQEDGRVKIGIGDVTGHGLESGVVMLMVQMGVRTLLCHHEQNQREVLSTLNRALYGNIKRMQTDKNLTLALLDYQAGVLQLSGQHEDVLLVKQNGSIERIDTISLGFMVGLVDDISGFIEKRNFELERGDGVVLYTDGVTEAFNPRGECYGLDRLCQVVSSHWQNNTSQVIKQIIIADIIEHLGGVQPLDDITLLVIKQK